MKKFNKGEWSELYVFFSALAEGKIYAADENLQKIENTFYVILKVIRDNVEYVRNNDDGQIIINTENESYSVSINEFLKEAPRLLENIKAAKGSSFEIPNIASFLEKIGIKNIKAKSTSKGDITIQIHDEFTGFKPVIDFSIKSYLGNTPTLLNASGATVSEFTTSEKLSTDIVEKVNSISGKQKIKDRLIFLKEKNINLEFSRLADTTFSHNLSMIDFRMPEIFSNLFLCSYFVQGKRVEDVVNYYCKHYYEDKELVEYKVKDLLVAIALGMVPKTKWSGLDEANGGYIIVKKDGEIVCYHIYDRNRLKEYLYKHTRFDSPSSSRTGAGILFSTDTTTMFRLTSQIRFI